MNIYVPPGAVANGGGPGQTPVMMWVYGGNYVSGTADIYDGRQLAAQGNVIVATINYRVGPFGSSLLHGCRERLGLISLVGL